LGVQGCGKSLSAKAIASLWKLPLLRLDVGKIFGGIVGQSEENMRQAIRIAESTAPNVIWIDELEKGFAGTQSSGISDGGTTARVFGTFISWLQDKTAPCFVVATANDVSALPPELLRKGRFDEIFFVDLPSRDERKQIFDIHLQRRKRDPKKFDLDALADATPGYSGAEIEQVVVSSLYDAFSVAGDADISDAALIEAAKQSVPLSVTMSEKIAVLRNWAKTRARLSSSAPPEPIATIFDFFGADPDDSVEVHRAVRLEKPESEIASASASV
jgi:SpoVK/Ycf46/Vps4 family AAA+-type ATPase